MPTGGDPGHLGVPITELALLNTFSLLLWQLKAVQQHEAAEGRYTSADPAVGLGERVLSFCLQMEAMIEAAVYMDAMEGCVFSHLKDLQDCIFRIQADLFLVFSSDKLEVGVLALLAAARRLCTTLFVGLSGPCAFRIQADLLLVFSSDKPEVWAGLAVLGAAHYCALLCLLVWPPPVFWHC